MNAFARVALLAAAVLCATSTVAAGSAADAKTARERGDVGAAIKILTPIAESGDPEANFELGEIYASGQGVEQDVPRAMSYWRRAAEKDHAVALAYLGMFHMSGEGGVPRDEVLAVDFFKRAAERGNQLAMVALGSVYVMGGGPSYRGRQIRPDPVAAWAWFSLAVERGAEPKIKELAGNQLRQLEPAMSGEDKQRAAAMRNELRSVIEQNARAPGARR